MCYVSSTKLGDIICVSVLLIAIKRQNLQTIIIKFPVAIISLFIMSKAFLMLSNTFYKYYTSIEDVLVKTNDFVTLTFLIQYLDSVPHLNLAQFKETPKMIKQCQYFETLVCL